MSPHVKTPARQLLRALRGSQTQKQFSASLGYRSNVAAEWEGGRRFPNADELRRVCALRQRTLEHALRAVAPSHDPKKPLHIWLDGLRKSSKSATARKCSASRHQIHRWCSGTAVPRVHELLALIDGLTGRVATFIAALVDIEAVPSMKRALDREHKQIQADLEDRTRRALALSEVSIDHTEVLVLSEIQLIDLRVAHREICDRFRSPEPHDPHAIAVLTLGFEPLA